MLKILLLSLLFISSLYSVEMGKSGGCTLTQSGKISVGYNDVKLTKFHYAPKALVGKNFRELFVGATLDIVVSYSGKHLLVKVLDYKPNKRIKGKPKTGVFIVAFFYNKKKKVINVPYVFNAGDMTISTVVAKNILKEYGITHEMKIWFETKIAYSLCHVR